MLYLAAWLSFSGCSDGRVASTTPPVTPVAWSDCGQGFECGAVTVPIDYDHPSAGTLDVAVARTPASDPAHRIGSLVFNPGGPGLSGIATLRLLAGFFPKPLGERFDLVSFDPRGTRDSGKIDCGSDVPAFVSALPLPPAPGALLPAAPLYAEMGRECERSAGSLLPFVGSVNTARDLDRIREALGDDQLTYLGLSYGTRLGAVYADLFPARVRAVVLDGAVDPTATLDQQARDEAQAAEGSLGRFLEACRARADCPLNPDPVGFYDALKARLASQPLPAPGGGDDHPVTVGDLEAATLSGISIPTFFGDQVLAALSAAAKGDGAMLRTLATGLFSDPDGPTSEFDAYWTILCADEREHPSALVAADLARELDSQYPRLGAYSVSYVIAGCSDWPVPAKPVPAVRAHGAAPIVVIGTTGDPNTPYVWAQHLAEALESAVLLTREGEGHTWFVSGFDNACVNDLVAAYLVDLQVPADGTTCSAGGTRS